MASERFQFHYVKTPVGTISGQAVLTQTEDAINELGQYMYDATTDATDALNKANEALATANTAQQNAAAAVATANSALDSVNSLTVIVNSWESSIQEAVTDASQAVQTANTASENASQAVTTANAANNTANTALSNSQSAISTANNADQLATEAKATAQEALSTAEEAVRDTASDLAQVQTLVQTATDQANAASSSASAAATSAQAADNSANLAQDWAVKMDGMVTDDGTEEGTPVDYSSKYYAQQAAASASAASDSEDAAASSASAAANSQQAAATSAGQASTSATNAAGSATAAAGSATAAQNAQTAAEAARDLAQQYASANAHAVVYDPQTLTAEQKQQARTNIGAISADQVALGYLPLTGGTMTGKIWFESGVIYSNNINQKREIAFKAQIEPGDENDYDGAMLSLRRIDDESIPGAFFLSARNGIENEWNLTGKPDGTLTWGDRAVEQVVGIGNGWIRYQSGLQICWGEVIIPSNQWSTTGTFPVAFSATSYKITGSYTDGQTNGETVVGIAAVSSTTFQVCVRNAVQGNYNFQRNVYYIAIGTWK